MLYACFFFLQLQFCSLACSLLGQVLQALCFCLVLPPLLLLLSVLVLLLLLFCQVQLALLHQVLNASCLLCINGILCMMKGALSSCCSSSCCCCCCSRWARQVLLQLCKGLQDAAGELCC